MTRPDRIAKKTVHAFVSPNSLISDAIEKYPTMMPAGTQTSLRRSSPER